MSEKREDIEKSENIIGLCCCMTIIFTIAIGVFAILVFCPTPMCDKTIKAEECPNKRYYSEFYSVNIPIGLIYNSGKYAYALFDVSEIYRYNQTLHINPYKYDDIKEFITPNMKLCVLEKLNTDLRYVYSSQSRKVGVILESDGTCIPDDITDSSYKTLKTLTDLFYISIILALSFFILTILSCCFYCCKKESEIIPESKIIPEFDIEKISVNISINPKPDIKKIVAINPKSENNDIEIATTIQNGYLP